MIAGDTSGVCRWSFLVNIVSCNVTIVSEVSLMQFGSGRLDKLLH